jgi:hypothetical protein
MNHAIRAATITWAWAAASCVAAVVQAAEPPPGKAAVPTESLEARPEDDQSVREAKAFAVRAALETKLWEIVVEDDDRTHATDQKDPVLKWSWSDNGRYYGNVHVYSSHGRPVAIVKFFQWFAPIEGVYFQCTSLTDAPLTATRDGRKIWMPGNNNVVMQDVPDAPVPANTAGARLIQMRHMAEDFKFEVDDKRGTGTDYTVRQLRLMPRPIIRYGEPAGEFADGAIFAYAVNTDPGAMLILEAVRVNDSVRWRYGVPRAWSFSARGAYLGKQVWDIKEIDPRLDSKANFYLNELPRTVK